MADNTEDAAWKVNRAKINQGRTVKELCGENGVSRTPEYQTPAKTLVTPQKANMTVKRRV
jgi:hypothetical protein